jgi:Copper type II ascorbate-dependent monooxygenase, C-terminal domain
MKRLTLIFLAVGLVAVVPGCTKADPTSGDDDGSDSVQLVDGFDPPPAAEGYKRYILPAVYKLQPGEDKMFCTWIELPAGADIDVLDVQGYQSKTGHHIVLYSTSETSEETPVGFSRECTTNDMVSVEFLGGIGGEGGGSVTQLPPGYVFREGQGRMLLANTHYLNATDSVLDVQSVVDVKSAPTSPSLKPAGMAVINYLDFQIPANSSSYTIDAYCTWPTDTSLFMWSNHMHGDGTSAYSEAKRPDGTIIPLVNDTSWQAEEAFNPAWKHWDVTNPTVIHAGDEMHVSCTWKNLTSSMVLFPDEMCDAVGFYAESGEELICDGNVKAAQ